MGPRWSGKEYTPATNLVTKTVPGILPIGLISQRANRPNPEDSTFEKSGLKVIS